MSMGSSSSRGMVVFGNFNPVVRACSMWFGAEIVGIHTTLPPCARHRLTAWGLSPPTWLFRAMAPNVRMAEPLRPCRSSSATSVAVEWWCDFATNARPEATSVSAPTMRALRAVYMSVTDPRRWNR